VKFAKFLPVKPGLELFRADRSFATLKHCGDIINFMNLLTNLNVWTRLHQTYSINQTATRMYAKCWSLGLQQNLQQKIAWTQNGMSAQERHYCEFQVQIRFIFFNWGPSWTFIQVIAWRELYVQSRPNSAFCVNKQTCK